MIPGRRPSALSRLALVGAAAAAVLAMGLRKPVPAPETAPPAPPAVAALPAGDKLIVAVPLASPDGKRLEGKLSVALVGNDNHTLAEADREVHQAEPAASYRFELARPAVDAGKLTLRYRFGDRQVDVPLNQALLVKGQETSLVTGQEFFSGSPGTIRCDVHGVRSITENVPLAGAEVVVKLHGPDGKVHDLLKEKTGADGFINGQFHVPQLPAGKYKLQVATRSAFGQETLEREVRIRADARILLVTDKPLYQPGQVIHLRALALQSFDLRPVADREMVFEVEDAKANKVFKRTLKTSAYGVAAVDFQLADEVNMGDYHIRAVAGEQQAEKTVSVRKYVLPKFKVELTADKPFYLPQETVHADLQSDYFFGKPVAHGKVKVTASTFDVAFHTFQTWQGTTDGNGHAKFKMRLPAYFVGQPLAKGNALVRFEVQLTDSADHTETVSKTYPVSDQPIKVSLLPDGGQLVPDMDNRVFAAAIYPDGSPARCRVKVWLGRQAQGEPLTTVRTNSAGLAEFHVRPKAKDIRAAMGPWQQRMIDTVNGQRPAGFSPRMVVDLTAAADDGKGHTAQAVAEVNSEPLGENVLLRLNKAVYRSGDTMKVDVRTSAGLPTVYLDLVRSGQTLLTRWLDVKNGRAEYSLDLPAEVFGTVEVHAYQTLNTGEIIRDSRVVYVQPRDDLKVAVKADRDVHQPGETGRIRFQVTDAEGKPTAAALGVIVVDEAVYALQEMHPGLEKVYFTLQEELLKPQAQAVYQPAVGMPQLIQKPELPPPQQEIAQALLSGARPKPPARWQVEPALERREKVQGQVQQIGWGLYFYASNHPDFMTYDKRQGHWTFKPGLLADAVKSNSLQAATLDGPFGKKWTLEELAKVNKDFTADSLARAVTVNHMQQLNWTVISYCWANQQKLRVDNQWKLPGTVVDDAVKAQRLDAKWTRDAWGHRIRIYKHAKPLAGRNLIFDQYELISPGPDGKLGTKDDVRQRDVGAWYASQWWWLDSQEVEKLGDMNRNGMAFRRMGRAMGGRGEVLQLGVMPTAPGAGFGGGGFGGGPMAPMAPPAPKAMLRERMMDRPTEAKADNGKGGGPGGGAAESVEPTRVREYFPETMLWRPALITDAQGRAELPLSFPDSITTWRLSASASSQGGLLGGVSAPLRVFQDFFIDLDLPVSLTQNDEVAFPVAVYNYLKEPQTVRLELQRDGWFELLDSAGPTRKLDLKPNEVTSVKFRIKARRVGFHPLTVKAKGTKLADAVKRGIEVVPDGFKVEKVATDRLEGRISQTIDVPPDAVADASKILVKVYPGIMSQVLEGTEGMLRLPGG